MRQETASPMCGMQLRNTRAQAENMKLRSALDDGLKDHIARTELMPSEGRQAAWRYPAA